MKPFYKDPIIWLSALVVGAVYVVASRVNLFEMVYVFTRTHESWELDELFAATFILPLILPIVLYRANRKLRVALADKEHAEQRAQFFALHDELTGLPNRRFLKAIFSEMQAKISEQRVTLMLIDLDGFKDINDQRGHEAGDLVLVEAANRLSNAVTGDGQIIRLGGDEFVVVAYGLADRAADTATAQALIAAISKPLAIGNGDVSLACSVGVTTMHSNMTQADLLRRADHALYASKAAGGSQATHHDTGLAPQKL